MSCFPLCIELTGKRVLLVGAGPQTDGKEEKLCPFGGVICRVTRLREEDLEPRPALVVVGDLPREEARWCSDLCRERAIPVNVVDRPELCSFFFPALIQKGELTVAVTTGGGSPAAAAWLRGRIETSLPERTEEILDSLIALRAALKAAYPGKSCAPAMKEAAVAAFGENRPLTEAECAALLQKAGFLD